MYKLSKSNLLAPYEDKHLLYNQVSGALIALDNSQYKDVYESDLHALPSAFIDLLKEGSFIVDEALDENKWLEDFYYKASFDSRRKELTIAPTDQCNLNCPYCFEHKNQWVKMDEATIEQTKMFVKAFVESSPTEIVYVTWFGGEPTLHMPAITSLTKYFDSLGVKMYYSMITNGTNLNKVYADKLIELNCMEMQITLDGAKEDHDRQRPFRKTMSLNVLKTTEKKSCGSGGCGSDDVHAKSSFDKIVSNLPYLWEKGFKLDLRINIGKQNLTAYRAVRKMLEDMGLSGVSPAGGYIRLYPSRIFYDDNTISHKEFLAAHPDFEFSELKQFTGRTCMANRNWSFGISQNGRLSKCWEHITNEENLVGTVWDMDVANRGYFDYYSPTKDPVCKDCEVLASCWGGCRSLNEFYKVGYEGKKYDGCDQALWNSKEKVTHMYRRRLVTT